MTTRKNPAAVALGALGGKSKSPAKLAAIAKNAKLGGWPKGKKRGPRKPTITSLALAMRRKAIGKGKMR